MKFIDIVFAEEHIDSDSPPDLRFIEVENAQGASLCVGQWVEREDGYTVLRLFEDVTEFMTEEEE